MDVSVRGMGLYVFGRFRLNPNTRTLTHDDAAVELRPTVFDFLLYLVEHPGRLVSKDELLLSVWQRRTVEEANLSQTVFWLRAAMREHGGASADSLILTARGQGYRFTAPVVWRPAEVAEMFSDVTGAAVAGAAVVGAPDPVDAMAGPGRPAFWRRKAVVVAAMLVGMAGVLGGLAAWRGGSALRPGNTIVLAEIRNQTGDAVFDRTLGDVARIDLGQSPYVTVMSDRQARDTVALMTRPRDAAMVAPLAQEVCTRANADGVLGGGVSSTGAGYVLTLMATDCSGQRTLAAAKAEIGNRAGVVPALDRLLGEIRERLGEPIGSVDRFNVPLMAEKTASLEALKAYSEGLWLNDHGRRNEATLAFRHAIDLDGDFAAAYSSLAVVYKGTNQDQLAAGAATRAYQLRDRLNERGRLLTVMFYDQFATRDFDETLRTLQLGLLLYPNDAKLWTNLANAHNVLGQYEDGVRAARHAVSLDPGFETAYVVLARAELRSGHPEAALAAGGVAIRKGLAGDATHGILLAADAMLHDEAGMQSELAWAKGKPGERILLTIAGQIAYQRGQMRAGDALFDLSAELSRQQGLPDFARAYRARLLVDLGLPDRAREMLAGARDADDVDYLFTVAEVGDATEAASLLAGLLARYSHGTIEAGDFGPEVRAALALRGGDAGAAVAALQPALRYQSRTFDIAYVLGRSALARGDGARARGAFQTILDHQGWYPESPLYALAQLGLARSDLLVDDAGGARRAYAAFLAGWADADTDQPLLAAAKRELAGL